MTAVDYVVNYFESLFTNPITISINLGYGEVHSQPLLGALGESISSYTIQNYSSVASALTAQNAPGCSTLPGSAPLSGSLQLTHAEACALGLVSAGGVDGYVGIGNTFQWDYSPNTTPAAGAYDFVGTLEHEITEVMGRISLINFQPNNYAPMDLFRYTSTGARDTAAGGSGSLAYFSVDGGQTLLKSWNNDPNNGDLGDWYGQGGNDSANDYSSSGVTNPFSATDITLMQAIGWTVASSGPVAPTIASFSTDTGALGDHITSDNTPTFTGTAGANSTITVYDGATSLGTTTADGSGNWSFTAGTLTDGAHSITATVTDGTGTSPASTALDLTIDTTAPGAPTIASFSNDSGTVGDGLTNDNTPTLSGTAEANSTVTVYDGATALGTTTADGSGNWSYTTGTLSDGSHSLTAKATDAAGNQGAASASLSLTVDTTAPGAPVISGYGIDSGTVGDGLTNDNTPTLSGTAEANSTVTVYDGSTALGTTSADGSGNWSYTTGTLSDGSHSLTAKATDAAGNQGVASSALSLTIDTVAPGAPVISGFTTDSGTVGDGLTNDNTPTLSGTAAAASTVTVYDGSTALGTTTADGSGAWSYTTGILSDGAHSLTAKATDAAGNQGVASSALSLTIDTTAPVTPVIGGFTPDSGTVGDGLTNDNTPTLSGTAEASSTITVYDGSTALGTTTADGSGAWSYTTGTLSDGAHSLTVKSTDAAGNASTSSAFSLTIDTVAPGAPVISGFTNDSGTVGDGITNDNTPTLSGTAAAGSTITVYDGSTALGTTTADGSGAWSYTTGTLSDGAHSLTAKATDAAGNQGAASSALSLTIDTVAPTAPVIGGFATDSGTVGDGLTNDNTPTLSGTATAGSTVTVYDGSTALGTATADGSGAWSYTTGALSDGAHSFTAKASDAAGNTSTSSAFGVTIDTAAPGAPVISGYTTDTGVVGDGITSDNTPTLSGTAEANSTITVYDGATALGTTSTDGSGAWSYTTGGLSNGSHSLTAKATDAAGNQGAASSVLSLTIQTTAPAAPVISGYTTDSGTVGDGITNDNTPTLSGTAAANSTVTVYDGSTALGTTTADGSGAWSYTTGTLSDSAHSLTAKATDAAGNQSAASSTLSLTIDTVAPGAPVISGFTNDSGTVGDGITNDNTPTLSGTAAAGSTITVYDGSTALGTTSADGSGAWSYTTGTLSDGAHSLTAKATDAAGNQGAASSALSLTIDTVAPTAPVIGGFAIDSGTVGDGITTTAPRR